MEGGAFRAGSRLCHTVQFEKVFPPDLPQPSTLDPQPSTLNPQSATLNLQPWGGGAFRAGSRPYHTVQFEKVFFFFFITLGLELSDTKVYEP